MSIAKEKKSDLDGRSNSINAALFIVFMVVSFVGFVGAWTKEVFGPEALPLAGVVGALVVTFFTFLPSFMFILLGAPFIESTRNKAQFTAPLTAITAAVVGVILNLALFFAYHVLWPNGFDHAFEFISLLIGIVAFICLFHYKHNILLVIAGSALVGLLISVLN